MENKQAQKPIDKKKKKERKFHGIEIPQPNDLKYISRRLKKLKKEYRSDQTPSKSNLRETKKLAAIYDKLLAEKATLEKASN